MAGLRRAVVAIDGMVCHSCVQACSLALEDLGQGVAGFEVSLARNEAAVDYAEGAVDAARIRAALEDCGFDAAVVEDGPALGLPPDPGAELVVDMRDNGELAVATRARRQTLDTVSDEDIPVAAVASDPAGGEPPPPSPGLSPAGLCQTVYLRVEGMTCASCVNSITRKLARLPGVKDAKVALLAEKAEVRFEPAAIDSTAIADVINSLGFEATLLASTDPYKGIRASTDGGPRAQAVVGVDFRVYGAKSPKDLNLVNSTLSSAAGVQTCSVDKDGRVAVTFDSNVTGARALVDAVDALGFNLLVISPEGIQTNAQMESLQRIKEIRSWRDALIFASAFTIPLMFINMLLPQLPVCHMWLMMDVIPGLSRMDLIGFVLSTPVQFGVGRRFYASSWKGLRHGIATMDVLVVLGTSTAYLYSLGSMLVSVFTGGQAEAVTFWETPASLITFIVLGRYLENVAKGRTTTALSSLLTLGPTFATLLNTRDGVVIGERRIPVELVQRGDLLKVMPGEKFPVDGLVEWGETTADESLLSGEARPVSKHANDAVIGGTLNQSGTVHVRAIKVGGETALSQIVRLVDEAQTSRAPIQDIADRVAAIFVPIIVLLGFVTFVVWTILLVCVPGVRSHFPERESLFAIALQLGISVIVVACPCTLGLATPTAVMVGTGVGAQMGILIKGGAPLEMAGRVNKILFDKTGTLTKGKLDVVATQLVHGEGKPASPGHSLDNFYQLVGLAESNSEHPLGRAIAAHALRSIARSGFQGRVVDFTAVPGAGVSATIELDRSVRSVAVGNLRLLRQKGFGELPSHLQTESDARNASGHTVVWALVDGELYGMVVLADTLKPEAKAAVSALRSLGLQVAMVTGDARRTAEVVARECGIDEVHAEVTPAAKADIVDAMQASGYHVAFVGDGVNDSVAISKANVGIAVGAGTDVTMEAAQIVLVKDNLMDVPTALHLSRSIFRRIKLNFLFSFIYNVVMVPLAMGFLIPLNITLPPMAAGAAMAMSSVSVVMSSLLLKRYRKPDFCVASELGISAPVVDIGDDAAASSSFVPMDIASDEEALLAKPDSAAVRGGRLMGSLWGQLGSRVEAAIGGVLRQS
ncbi:hypothetical protein DFJ74DRAFT_687929 [Hyaloraphidium curvatum]|nr:hypothetical protein DFJ74DRAFT_687929 [Hyaloraphidium curvatum]